MVMTSLQMYYSFHHVIQEMHVVKYGRSNIRRKEINKSTDADRMRRCNASTTTQPNPQYRQKDASMLTWKTCQ